MPKISIIWDFDQTLTPEDSTTKTVECLGEYKNGSEFWQYVKSLRGDQKKPKWEHVLASDAPIWMYALSRIATKKKVPLNREFFEKFVLPEIKLFPKVLEFLESVKSMELENRFKEMDLEIHHFIVSAGLKDLIELVFPEGLVTKVFGCRYEIISDRATPNEPESIPVFCMDETMKTRSIFEISKGVFIESDKEVNARVSESTLWSPFPNIIYIGDGPTDVPSLSLVRSKGGVGIAVYDPKASKEKVQKRLRQMRLDKRADLITKADFSKKSELYSFIKNRCLQICQRYEAENST